MLVMVNGEPRAGRVVMALQGSCRVPIVITGRAMQAWTQAIRNRGCKNECQSIE